MQIAIPLVEDLTALDAIGPYEVLSRLPGADVVFAGAEARLRSCARAWRRARPSGRDGAAHDDGISTQGDAHVAGGGSRGPARSSG